MDGWFFFGARSLFALFFGLWLFALWPFFFLLVVHFLCRFFVVAVAVNATAAAAAAAALLVHVGRGQTGLASDV